MPGGRGAASEGEGSGRGRGGWSKSRVSREEDVVGKAAASEVEVLGNQPTWKSLVAYALPATPGHFIFHTSVMHGMFLRGTSCQDSLSAKGAVARFTSFQVTPKCVPRSSSPCSRCSDVFVEADNTINTPTIAAARRILIARARLGADTSSFRPQPPLCACRPLFGPASDAHTVSKRRGKCRHPPSLCLV